MSHPNSESRSKINTPESCLGALGIIGISGRMGQRIVSTLEKTGQCTWIGGYSNTVPEKGEFLATPDLVFQKSDVVMDFSHGSLFPEMIQVALANPRPLIVGTSGIEDGMMALLQDLARKVPVIWAPNTSLGAVIQRWVAGKLAEFLPENYDIDIIETHHRHKKDTPSGTALALGKAIQMAKKGHGIDMTMGETTSPRSKNRIEMHALRCGDVSGMHDVMWTSPDDRLVVGHTVFSPHVFAQGAVSLLKWLPSAPGPGLYTVEDVLGLTNA